MDYKKTLSPYEFYFLNYRIFQAAQNIKVQKDFNTCTEKIKNEILKDHFEPFNKKNIDFQYFKNEVLKVLAD